MYWQRRGDKRKVGTDIVPAFFISAIEWASQMADHLSLEVRAYVLKPDGTPESLFSKPLFYFGGVCPNVGDVIFDDLHKFLSVQRRYYMEPGDGSVGWLLIVRELECVPPHTAILKEWTEETSFWRGIRELEQEEIYQNTLKRASKPSVKPKSSVAKGKGRGPKNPGGGSNDEVT